MTTLEIAEGMISAIIGGDVKIGYGTIIVVHVPGNKTDAMAKLKSYIIEKGGAWESEWYDKERDETFGKFLFPVVGGVDMTENDKVLEDQARRQERERIENALRSLTVWPDGTWDAGAEVSEVESSILAMAADVVQSMGDES